MKNVLLAMLALFALTATPMIHAEEMPEAPADESPVEAPPTTDPATDAGEAN